MVVRFYIIQMILYCFDKVVMIIRFWCNSKYTGFSFMMNCYGHQVLAQLKLCSPYVMICHDHPMLLYIIQAILALYDMLSWSSDFNVILYYFAMTIEYQIMMIILFYVIEIILYLLHCNNLIIWEMISSGNLFVNILNIFFAWWHQTITRTNVD